MCAFLGLVFKTDLRHLLMVQAWRNGKVKVFELKVTMKIQVTNVGLKVIKQNSTDTYILLAEFEGAKFTLPEFVLMEFTTFTMFVVQLWWEAFGVHCSLPCMFVIHYDLLNTIQVWFWTTSVLGESSIIITSNDCGGEPCKHSTEAVRLTQRSVKYVTIWTVQNLSQDKHVYEGDQRDREREGGGGGWKRERERERERERDLLWKFYIYINCSTSKAIYIYLKKG